HNINIIRIRYITKYSENRKTCYFWRLIKMITVNKERLVNKFIELVQIDSETKHEQEISKVLKQKFSDLGLEVIEDTSKEKTGHGSGNLICTLKGPDQEANTIYFTSHMD